MKFAYFLFVSQLLELVVANETQLFRRRLVKQVEECVLVKRDMRFDDGSSVETWTCELQDNDAYNAGKRFVDLEGLDDEDFEGVRSGVTTLFVDGAVLANGKLIIPNGAKRYFGKMEPRGPAAKKQKERENNGVGSKQQRMLAPLVDERLVLVVRVKASDATTTSSTATIADKVFGTAGDVSNLRERFEKCSYGEMLMQPFIGTTSTGKSIQNGVYQVTISAKVKGVQNTIVEDNVEAALTQQLGNLPNQFDHVMLCLPPGTMSGWIAYGYLGSWLTVYNNEWCNYPSAQVHELGHNLNLNHADEEPTAYGDQTGLMGYSYADDTTIMCFNTAKSWQLGWFNLRRLTLNFSTRGGFNGKIIGIAGYGHLNSAGKYALVKIDNQSTLFSPQTKVFIGFNSATGINSGTKEAANQVTVHTQLGSGKSNLIAKIGAGGAYTLPNFQGTQALHVNVKSISLSATPPVADVDIFLSGCPPGTCGAACNSCCSDNDCTTADTCAVGVCQQGSCSYDTSNCPGNFRLQLTTDIYPGETSWDVVDMCSGQTKFAGGPYSISSTTFSRTATLGQSWYKFTMRDSYGDGLSGGTRPGSFFATFDGVEVATGGYDFGRQAIFYFGTQCVTNSALGSPTLSPVTPPPTSPSPVTPPPTSPSPVTPPPTSSPVTPPPTSPSPVTPPPGPTISWVVIFQDGFENGFTTFTSGGKESKIITQSDGSKSLELRDDKSTSIAFTTNSYSVSAFTEVRVRFFFFTVDVDATESFFLDWSSNNGSSWNVAKKFIHGIDYGNNQWNEAQVSWSLGGTSSIKLRFRSLFSDSTEKVYIDTVVLEAR